MEMTLEQKKAMALAAARVRAQGAESAPSSQRDLASEYAGEDIGGASVLKRTLGGAKSSWDRAAMGLKGLFTDLTPEDKALLEQGRAFQDEGGAPATIGAIGADVAMSAAPGALVTKATAAAPVLTRALSQLGLGAGYGALTSPEDRTTGAVAGGVGTGVGMAANRVIGGAIKPFISKDAEALMAQGIQPTPGQAIGGAVNTAEQKLKSLPLVGDVIRGARNRSVNEFNEKAIQTAVPGAKGFGDEALTAARETLGNKYDEILDKIPRMNLEREPIINSAKRAAASGDLGLNDQSKQYVRNYVANNMLGRGNSIDGQTAKRIESDLLKVINTKRSSSVAEERQIAEALSRVHDTWRDSLAGMADAAVPGAGKELLENNRAWRAFVALDRAGGYRGNQNLASNEVAGRFTPNSLRRSIETSDTSQFNNATRGAEFRTPKTPVQDAAQATEQTASRAPGRGPIIPEFAELASGQGRLPMETNRIGYGYPVSTDVRQQAITDILRNRAGQSTSGVANEAAQATQAAATSPRVVGEAPFDRLNRMTRQAERVLGDSVPDSGTATRMMWGAGALGAGAATGADLGTAAALGAVAVPAYSRMGSQFLMQGVEPAYKSAVQALTLRGVPMQTVDEALRKYGPQGVISLARSIGVNTAQQ